MNYKAKTKYMIVLINYRIPGNMYIIFYINSD